MKKILFGILCMMLCANSYALPAGYTQLEYLESTSRDQYINTGISPTNNTGFIIDFQYTNTDTSEQIMIGSFDPNFLIDRFTNDSNGQRMFGYAYRPQQGLNEYFSISDAALTARHVSELNWQNSGLFRFDDITQTLPANTFSNSLPIYIFSCSGLTYLGTISGRVYSVKISNNANIVRDFIPVRRNSDGVLGMYDTVTNTLFTNAGTGTFIAGPEIGIASTSYVQGAYETLNSAKMAKSVSGTIEWTQGSTSNGIITSVVGAGDKFQVSRTDITIPVGSPSSPTGRMGMWLE